MSQIAQTTWNQITVGTKMSIGARQPTANDNQLFFMVANHDRKLRFRKIEVTLDPSDTYTVKMWTFSKDCELACTNEASNVYCDNLNAVLISFCK